MPVIVQDETGLIANANSYIATTFLDTWLTSIGITTSYTEDQKNAAVITATRYIDSIYEFAGTKVNDDEDVFVQTTEFPRETDTEDSGIRLWLQRATAEYAKFILVNGAESLWNNVSTDDMGISRLKEKVADLEIDTSYSGSSSGQAVASVPIADNLIRKSGWLANSSGVITRC